MVTQYRVKPTVLLMSSLSVLLILCLFHLYGLTSTWNRGSSLLKRTIATNAFSHWPYGFHSGLARSTERTGHPSLGGLIAGVVSRLQERSRGIEYPVNLLRSVALKRVTTTYVFYADADMTPSHRLRSSFLRHVAPLSNHSATTAYVVPAFEVSKTRDVIPTTKSALLEGWARQEIRPYHHNSCFHCQSVTDYPRWRALPVGGKMAVAYRVSYRPKYEPYYIAPSTLPLYDERFRQWGRDRQSQMCEMHVAGYQLAVLNNAFLVHDGLKNVTQRPPGWLQNLKNNDILYRHFQHELKEKYPRVRRTCS